MLQQENYYHPVTEKETHEGHKRTQSQKTLATATMYANDTVMLALIVRGDEPASLRGSTANIQQKPHHTSQ